MIRDAAGVPVLPLRAPGRAEAVPDAPAPQPAPVVNPRLRIDPALNMIVIEFRDETGEVGHSIPSPRELAAYRRNAPPAEEDDAAPSPPPAATMDVTR